MARDEEELADIVERSAAILAAGGFPKMPARVLMTLMVAESGLTASELSDRLTVSAAAVSGAVRYLQSIGYVHRVAQAGSRRDRYELPRTTWYRAAMHRNPLFPRMAVLGDLAVEAIGAPDSEASQRVGEMARFYRFIESKLPELLQEWDEVEGNR